MTTIIVPRDLEARVDPLIGAPFSAGGRTPEGWDCAGCAAWIWRSVLGLALPGIPDGYGPEVTTSQGRRRRAALIASGARAYAEVEPQAGAIARFRRFGVVGHIGVMLDRRRFIHADMPFGTAIGALEDPASPYEAAGFVAPLGVTLMQEGAAA